MYDEALEKLIVLIGQRDSLNREVAFLNKKLSDETKLFVSYEASMVFGRNGIVQAFELGRDDIKALLNSKLNLLFAIKREMESLLIP